MENLFILIVFSTAFIFTMLLAGLLDWALRSVFHFGIFPKGFFKTSRKDWAKW